MEDAIYIPIPHYPPFKLRSSLIDKDPVIWAHLLAGYIKLCKILLTGEVKLDAKSHQQFQLFVKVFLAETSEEKHQIFSLGAINPDIKSNTAALRTLVFQIVCDYGAMSLALNGESLWNFSIVYVENNASLVRGIVVGSHKSRFNDNKKSGKISSAPVLRKHLLSVISSGKARRVHLEVLAQLLGQHIAASTKTYSVTGGGTNARNTKVLARDKYKQASGSGPFAEIFVTEDWIEDLESMYAGGKSVHAETVRNWMVVSVLSLGAAKLAKVVSTIGIHGAETMVLAPLLSSIILSDAYRQRSPGLEERLPFLRTVAFGQAPAAAAADADVDFLLEMFPRLSAAKARKLLLRHDNNIDRTTNAVLENSSLIEELSDGEEAAPRISETELERGIRRFQLSSNETTEKFGKKGTGSSAQDAKKNTLTAALRLLYESDEDERDDTYDDQEHTTGSAFESVTNARAKEKANVFSDESASAPASSSQSRSAPEFDPNEVLLFGFLKTGGDALFDKGSRKSAQRKAMRQNSGWTDEQIEGWSRMLKRSSKRFRLLEEHYAFSNSNRRPARAPRPDSAEPESGDGKSAGTKGPARDSKKPDEKVTQKRNEANKARKANHSRKSGHSRKTKADLVGMQ